MPRFAPLVSTHKKCVRRARELALIAGFVAGALRSADARDPASSCDRARSWVGVRFDESVDRIQQAAVLRDLSAGLPRMTVCAQPSDSGDPPVSSVLIGRTGQTATIEVRDAVTEKRLARDLDLSLIPEDGHALALAVAADELLRASWAELALRKRREHTTRPPPPPEVDASVQDALEVGPLRKGSHRLGGRVAFEAYGVGQLLLGADVTYAYLRNGWSLDLWLGARQGLEVDVELGSVQAQGIVSGLSLSRELLAVLSARVGPVLALQGGYFRFRGRSLAGAEGDALTGPILLPRVGAFVVGQPGSWQLRLEGGVGAPLVRVLATADGSTVTGISGLEAWGSLGTGVVF